MENQIKVVALLIALISFNLHSQNDYQSVNVLDSLINNSISMPYKKVPSIKRNKVKKVLPSTWQEVYQLPLRYDRMNYCWSKNDIMTLMFDETLSESDREMITKAINGEYEFKMKDITSDGCDILLNGTYIFCVRGWGHLTGTGALNLPQDKATQIQDSFINYIKQTLR